MGYWDTVWETMGKYMGNFTAKIISNTNTTQNAVQCSHPATFLIMPALHGTLISMKN